MLLVTVAGKAWPGDEVVVAEGHDGMRNVSDVSARVPRFPPLPGVVKDFEELSADHGQLLVVASCPGVGHLGNPGSTPELESTVIILKLLKLVHFKDQHYNWR